MNQPTKNTFRIDLIVQGLFYIPMIVLYVLGFLSPIFLAFGAMLQILVGASQVISGAYHAAYYNDQKHKHYFIGAIGYLAFLFLAFAGFSEMQIMEMAIIPLVFVIPVGIATWYYRLTWMEYKNAAPETDTPPSNPNYFQEDLLDDAML